MSDPSTLTDTLVLDIGKSNAKLVVIGTDGHVRARRQQANASVEVPELGYRALGVAALEAWLRRELPSLASEAAIGRIAITTHGAAFCAMDDHGLTLPPIDYEWDGYGDFANTVHEAFDPFAHNGTPHLPQGLNAGLQLAWVHRHRPAAAARIRHWLPYPQFWAWWFTGVMASEVSSLACHTGLWSPTERRFSDWAQREGLAPLFPPLQPAHAVLGKVRQEQAAALGLSPETEVIVGVHDSNACLARYLRSQPDAVVVSSGTWCVLMAAGGPIDGLDAARDELVNVAVDGQAVPTARFMGGREVAAICGDADPKLADEASLAEVLDAGWMAHPSFAESGGPWSGSRGSVSRHGHPVPEGLAAVPPRLRPALAALYAAEVTAHLVERLSRAGGPPAPVILEGPLAHNAAWRVALASLLPTRALWTAQDNLEGTARGAWMLSRWASFSATGGGADAGMTGLQRVPSVEQALASTVKAHAAAWAARLVVKQS